ncbi:hypothetical protein C8Q74DRAFT_1306585 [Fomes fomentarius]|nr:hypothetical protein C8Q74DRAFT_1306585 [Fomes fomentarius]
MLARITRKSARTKAEDAEAAAGENASGSSIAGAVNDGAGGFIQDAEFWFDDGTIILLAQGVAFKVYRGPLVEHSAVFKDMLSFPQPPISRADAESSSAGPSNGAQAQECPQVTLYDSPYDMRHVLRVLMPRKRIRLVRPISFSANATLACARLAHKYQIDQLLEESLKLLRKCYTDDIDVCRRRHEITVVSMTHCAIPVVNIARLTGADYLLPMALAHCCRLGAAIVNGYIHEDGTREYLAPADLGLCFQAKEKLIEARVKAVTHILDQPRLVVNCALSETDDKSSSPDAAATSNPDTAARERGCSDRCSTGRSRVYTPLMSGNR